jgi:putative nucleotidyltransferase with HDIG domain
MIEKVTIESGADTAIASMMATIGELPAAPSVVSAVMGLTSDPDSKVADLSRVLAADQSLTAKVLRLSNSSFYGRAKEVRTLVEAVILLGFQMVESLVVATSAHSLYQGKGHEGIKLRLWRHSFSTAVTARQLAVRTEHPNMEEVFVAGLLHDIGKLVLLQKFPEIYTDIVHRVEVGRGCFVDVEREVLGFSHDRVAGILLQKWSFPGSLVMAVDHHHRLPELIPGKEIPIAFLVNLGDHLAKVIEPAFNQTVKVNPGELESARALGLSDSDLAETVRLSEEYYRSEVRVFETS